MGSSLWSTKKCLNTKQDFFLLFQHLVAKLDLKDIERWVVISWAIWNARNKFYFERTQTQPKMILDGVVSFLDEYQKLMAAQ